MSRRVIAKYRDELGIPSTLVRKESQCNPIPHKIREHSEMVTLLAQTSSFN